VKGLQFFDRFVQVPMLRIALLVAVGALVLALVFLLIVRVVTRRHRVGRRGLSVSDLNRLSDLRKQGYK